MMRKKKNGKKNKKKKNAKALLFLIGLVSIPLTLIYRKNVFFVMRLSEHRYVACISLSDGKL